MSVVDVVLGSLVLGLAGWALVQSGRAKPAGGCGPSGCGPRAPAAQEGDGSLVTLGGPRDDAARER